jgi:transcriptional regulator with XRE-family HTH domain
MESIRRLREMRINAQISQKDLALKIGMQPTIISRIECGRAKCGELIARRLGDYFMCDWKYFLSEDVD